MSMADNPLFWPFSSLLIHYFIKQTAQSMTNNHLSLMSLLRILRSIWSSSGRYIQRHTSTVKSVKAVHRESYNTLLPVNVTKIVWNTNPLTTIFNNSKQNFILSSTAHKQLCQFLIIFIPKKYPCVAWLLFMPW